MTIVISAFVSLTLTPMMASRFLKSEHAQKHGPQAITRNGRRTAVVVSAEEFRRLKGERSGDALIAAMQASPYRDIDIEPKRDRMPVRGVDL